MKNMNREIKYKAWDNKWKVMYENVFVNSNGVYDLADKTYDTPNIELKKYDLWVIPLQSTFQLDVKYKEIYVGDILSEKWKVEVYQNDEGTFMVRFHTNPKGNKPMTLKTYLIHREKAGAADRDCVVIGNIYENPELLTKNEE